MFRVARICIPVIHASKGNFPAPGPNDITLLLLSKSCFSAHDCTNYFYCSLVHLSYFLDWLDWLGDWLSKVSSPSEAGENMPPLESWLKWYEPNDQNIFLYLESSLLKWHMKRTGIWPRGIRLLSLLNKIDAKSQVNLILPFFIYYLRHEWQLNSFFDFLWHFGEVQSLAMLSGGIFEHLVHSAHFWQCLTNRSHWKNLPVDRFFCKTNNFLHYCENTIMF